MWLLICIDWLIGFLIIDFHQLNTPDETERQWWASGLFEYMCNGVYPLRWEDWVGIVLPISSPELQAASGAHHRKHEWHLLKVAVPVDSNRWTIFVWLLIDDRLTDTNRDQLTNFIDWRKLEITLLNSTNYCRIHEESAKIRSDRLNYKWDSNARTENVHGFRFFPCFGSDFSILSVILNEDTESSSVHVLEMDFCLS